MSRRGSRNTYGASRRLTFDGDHHPQNDFLNTSSTRLVARRSLVIRGRPKASPGDTFAFEARP